MNTQKFAQHFQAEIKDKKYDEYLPLLHEYKNHLTSRIKNNPASVEATCQLAAVYNELRCSFTLPIKILEDFLVNHKATLTPNNQARVYTNLAFYYEDSVDIENCIRCLEEAVKTNIPIPNAYDALGRLYAENGNIQGGLELHKKLNEYNNNIKYRYNYAVTLFHSGSFIEAKNIFEILYKQNTENPQFQYGYGVCCFYCGETKAALNVADKLAQNGIVDDFISTSEIADLYYLCGEYQKHNKMYEDCKFNFYPDVTWLAPYFYGLKSQGNLQALKQKFLEVIAEKENDIARTKAEDLEEGFTKKDKEESISGYQKEKEDILQAYNKILNKKYKPEIKITLWYMYGCYLIDCPRHQPIE